MSKPKIDKLAHGLEHIILLHGLGRSRRSMVRLDKFLKKEGYRTWNVNYPSTKCPIEDLAFGCLAPVVEQCLIVEASRIHFVTHSLGGIVARQFMQEFDPPAGSRMVMLSPPNQGAEVVDVFKHLKLYQWITGPAGQELGTEPGSVPNQLKPISMEVGVITGDRSRNPFFSAIIGAESDGTVAVERTKLEEMTDFIIMPSTHTFIMRNPGVLEQVAQFLKNGRFKKVA